MFKQQEWKAMGLYFSTFVFNASYSNGEWENYKITGFLGILWDFARIWEFSGFLQKVYEVSEVSNPSYNKVGLQRPKNQESGGLYS